MLTVKEAAQRLHIAPDECRRWIYAGVLPGVKVGARWMIEEADLPHAAEHAEAYGVASNWMETFSKLLDQMQLMLEAIDRDGGFDELFEDWPPQAKAGFLQRFDRYVAYMQALSKRVHAADEVMTIQS